LKDYNKYKGIPSYLEDTMKKRYCQEGESTSDLYYIAKRVSDYVASGEETDELINEWSSKYLETMIEGYWLPSSPFLMNAGTKNSMLSACFVCGLEDDLESVYDTLKATGMIQRAGGGTGFNFGSLRAEGAPIKSTGGTSSGPLSFMEIFNASGETIKQGGRRRSANMGVMPITHPDIEKFIKYKAKRDKLNMFNVSVAITDDFMEAVIEDKDFDLIEPSTGEVARVVKAKELWDMITYYSWENAEPGILFIDRVNDDNPTPELGDIEATNPCGEIPLLPYEACNLASINVERFVDDQGNFDYDHLSEIAKVATRFLDTAIDVNELPLPIIEEAVKKTRKLGLGLMGLHGALIRMGIPYDSQEGRKVSEKIMECIYKSALEESCLLAEEKDVYPAWYESIHAHEKIRCRNATLTTIAPTGKIVPLTLAIM
jgi:ribonucleoside-diphosphate reductase alpha chain